MRPRLLIGLALALLLAACHVDGSPVELKEPCVEDVIYTTLYETRWRYKLVVDSIVEYECPVYGLYGWGGS